MEVGLCSFQGAEAARNKLYEPFKDRTKPCTCCRKIPEATVRLSSSQLKWGPDTQETEMFRAVNLWKYFLQMRKELLFLNGSGASLCRLKGGGKTLSFFIGLDYSAFLVCI